MLLSLALNPSTPLGDLLKALLLLIVQGGGLSIRSGAATLNSCTLFNNNAFKVRDKSPALSRLLVMKHLYSTWEAFGTRQGEIASCKTMLQEEGWRATLSGISSGSGWVRSHVHDDIQFAF